MSDSNLPVALTSGVLEVGGTKIGCFVVEGDDEGSQEPHRLLSGRAVTNAFNLTGRSSGVNRFLDSPRFRSKMSDKLVHALENPMKFGTGSKGLLPALGYEAYVLPELCFCILDANEEHPLPQQQQKIVAQAKILQRALSTVGIIALVDEATGYQYERQSDALQQILNMFISDELMKWAKTFPDEFYKQLYRLRGISGQEFVSKRPAYFGTLTNDIVYERLAPGVLEELRRVTPKDERGRRKHKFFMRLTQDIGHPRLREHLTAVIALMKAADSYQQFSMMLNRAMPKFELPPGMGGQTPLPLDWDGQ